MAKANSKVRFGLVGCGHIGAFADEKARHWAVCKHWLPLSHASAIKSLPQAVLTAVCDIDPLAANKAARSFGVPATFTDYRALLEKECPDILCIATRTQERAEIIQAAANAGVKGIYCEKPLCNTLEEADRIASLLKKKGVYFVYGTRRRFMPAYRQAKALVETGAIGVLTAVTVKFGFGLLFWSHPHSVDIAAYFAGDVPVEYVQADLALAQSDVKGLLVDADPRVSIAAIQYSNGVKGLIVPSGSFDVELTGNGGILSIQSNGSSLLLRNADGSQGDNGCFINRKNISFERGATGTSEALQQLMNALQEERKPQYSIDMAVKNQEVLFGFVYSHLAEGKRVRFPLERRGLRVSGRFEGKLA